MRLDDPGPCPICGALHSSCVAAPGGGIVVDMLPASTAAAALVADRVQVALPEGSFTSGTYRGSKKPRPPRVVPS
jgi:hypothetical protein